MNVKHVNDENNLSFWLKRIETISGSEKNIKLGLDSVRFYKEKLGLYKPAKQVITVAGTNGKGSTVKLLETIYSKAGYHVASFTSPHLIKFNERISINNKQIEDEKLIEAFEIIFALSQKYKKNYTLSYFEFVFLSAWYIYYNFYQLDLLILEVGLGGRLDATNVIDNDVSIITSIDFDHQKYLGDTLEKIAFEKSGIIKSQNEVIIGRNIPDIVLNRAKELNCNTYILGDNFKVIPNKLSYTGVNLENVSICHKLITLYNEKNILSLDINFLNEFFDNLISNFQMPARAELIKTKDFDIVFDVAHNPHSIKNLSKKIRYLKEHKHYKKIYAICGMLYDKTPEKCFVDLNNLIDFYGLIDLSLVSSRGMTSKDLSTAIDNPEIKYYKYAIEAYSDFKNILTKNDLLVVFGSFHTVGQLYDKYF